MNQPRDWTAEFDYLHRFFSYVRIHKNGCWIWEGGKKQTGYGNFRQGNRVFPAHRWAWSVLRSLDLEGQTLHHRCFNRACVNPDHLQVMSQSENSKIKKLRTCPNCKHRFA